LQQHYSSMPSSAPARNDPEYVAWLEQRITALEARIPQTGLLSHSFWGRAFAVLGHNLAAGLMVYLPILVLMLLAATSRR
jgi:hypothetical protein